MSEKVVRIAIVQRLQRPEHPCGGFIDVYHVMKSLAEKIEETLQELPYEALRMTKRHGYRAKEHDGWADIIIVANAE